MLLPPYGENKIDCSGCTACQHACPESSIVMQLDEEGFLYPIIDSDTCTSCEVCSSVCPIINPQENERRMETPDVYAAWHLAPQVRGGSSSGGVFSAFADKVLSQNGVVFGASFNEKLHLRHVGIETHDQLAALRGSKYLESHIGDTFEQAEGLIKQGRYVLFTGTPCQIAGLYAYLQQDYETLYTCDIFCHGVPSPKVFQRHIEHIAEKHHSQVHNYRFRSKQYGWRPYGIQIDFASGKALHMPGSLDPFTVSFLKDMFLRPVCSVCPFATTNRVADVSIGDFWGIGKYHPELDDNKGISTLLVNTPKGRELLKVCRTDLFIQSFELNQVMQGALRRAYPPSPSRADFFVDLDQISYSRLKRKYMLNRKQVIRYYAGRLKKRLVRLIRVIC